MSIEPTYIAMWSGPRNISTAMMRAFENRPDCVVWDEPFYAAYLAASGIDHPMRDEIIAAGPADAVAVSARLTHFPSDPEKPRSSIFYQKHMTHHMLPGFPRGWIACVTNAFLIREPDRVLASYARKRQGATLADIGYPFQCEIFDSVTDRLGRAPPVLDANDVLARPGPMLSRLCDELAIPFEERMLKWPAGLRKSDGVWAAHWYDAVAKSTGFAAPDLGSVTLPADLARVAEAARPFYERLARHRLVAV